LACFSPAKKIKTASGAAILGGSFLLFASSSILSIHGKSSAFWLGLFELWNEGVAGFLIICALDMRQIASHKPTYED
jgi:hypothetical protein